MQEKYTTWVTKAGQEIKICDMDTNHLKNCIRYLHDKLSSRYVIARNRCHDFDDLDMLQEQITSSSLYITMQNMLEEFEKRADK